MSTLTDMILPAGLVLLGAYVVSKLMGNLQAPPVCTGSVSQTCLGPVCWATCQSTGGSTKTPVNTVPVGGYNLPGGGSVFNPKAQTPGGVDCCSLCAWERFANPSCWLDWCEAGSPC